MSHLSAAVVGRPTRCLSPSPACRGDIKSGRYATSMFIRWQKYRSVALWHRGKPPIKRSWSRVSASTAGHGSDTSPSSPAFRMAGSTRSVLFLNLSLSAWTNSQTDRYSISFVPTSTGRGWPRRLRLRPGFCSTAKAKSDFRWRCQRAASGRRLAALGIFGGLEKTPDARSTASDEDFIP